VILWISDCRGANPDANPDIAGLRTDLGHECVKPFAKRETYVIARHRFAEEGFEREYAAPSLPERQNHGLEGCKPENRDVPATKRIEL
jgi:hypothetical protein